MGDFAVSWLAACGNVIGILMCLWSLETHRATERRHPHLKPRTWTKRMLWALVAVNAAFIPWNAYSAVWG